jgi:polyphenol oxidase
VTILPEVFRGQSWLIAAMSTRQGGVSRQPLGMNLSFNVGDDPERVRTNRERFFGGLGIRQDELVVPGQVHGLTVREVERAGSCPETDGLVTSKKRLFLCVTVADCVPVLLADPVTRTVAAVHAGWRGTAGGIVKRAMEILTGRFGVRPEDLLAYVGPSAGTCCYAVGDDVASRFPREVVGRLGDQPTVDLKAANRDQLIAAGLFSRNIEISPFCTISDHELFHSHRRDAASSGRMMAVIGNTQV